METNTTVLGIAGAVALAAAMVSYARPAARQPDKPSVPDSGALMITGKEGQACPLKHTDVKADISGFLARVTVTQEFVNPLNEPIEAVYVFPLPNRAAVDDMTMKVGDRTVKGLIKKREEARKIYEEARQRGQVASLLNQERPNVFTQAVANIAPGAKVDIVISYVETLKYEAGTYEFVFPMVVGPRYNPQGFGNPVVTPMPAKNARAGHDISVAVNVDAGLPIVDLTAPTHEVDTTRPDAKRATVHLRNRNEIPNRDFILRYKVGGRGIQDTVLAHHDNRGGFFTLILQPPDRAAAAEVTPKELVFVVDTSGSMHGFPMDKSKEVIKMALDGLHPRDTFNLILFSGDTRILFPQPVPATPENVRQAQHLLLTQQGSGGTEMMKAIKAALEPTRSQDHIRIVCFMTDGYVGNDREIVDEIKHYSNARVFSFGIGSSVNRYLLDKMAEAGRGEVEYVGLDDDGSAAAKRFWERVRNPLLTDISVDWNGLPVSEIYPTRVRDLFDAKPVVITGVYSKAAKGTIRLKGKMRGREVVREIPVNFPADEPKHDVLATLWARAKVEHLDGENISEADRAEITRLGLKYRLMTQYTSFVAVEEKVVNEGGVMKRVDVPLELPHGVSHEGIYGKQAEMGMAAPQAASPMFLRKSLPMGRGAMLSSVPVPPPPSKIADTANRPAEPAQAATNLDPQLAAVVMQVRSGVPARSITGYAFVNGGKASVKIYLDAANPATLAALKQLGLEVVTTKPGNLVIGKIAVEKLEALAKMPGVAFVSPDLGKA